eukprot:Pgem_evm1s15636
MLTKKLFFSPTTLRPTVKLTRSFCANAQVSISDGDKNNSNGDNQQRDEQQKQVTKHRPRFIKSKKVSWSALGRERETTIDFENLDAPRSFTFFHMLLLGCVPSFCFFIGCIPAL